MQGRVFGVIGAIALSVAVVGCGGGGGGGGSSPPVTPATTFLPPGTNTTLRNLSSEQTLSALSIEGQSDETNPNEPASVLPIEEGTTTQVTIRPSVANPNQRYDLRIQATNPSEGVSTDRTFSISGDTNTSALFRYQHDFVRVTGSPNRSSLTAGVITNDFQSTLSNLSYQVFGFWSNERTTTINDSGVFSAGLLTAQSAIPTSGTATYQGFFFGAGGVLPVNASNAYTVSAQVSAGVDFGARTMDFRTFDTHRFRNSTEGWLPYADWNMSGNLRLDSGVNGFRGDVRSASGTMTGVTVGRFYGPAAEEMGGCSMWLRRREVSPWLALMAQHAGLSLLS